MMHEHLLGGCTPTPLAHYLKALGILRLVAEQKDPKAAGRWQGEQFVLRTVLTREELERFFQEEYRPTPVLSPWNGRAGYLEGDDGDSSQRTGAVLLRDFRNSQCERLQNYRELISALDAIEPIKEMNGIRAQKKAKDAEKKQKQKEGTWADADQQLLSALATREAFLKENLLTQLRNALKDDLLVWLDGTVALGADKAFAPLLGGSGGVEGSMDLGVNFMENIRHLISFADGKATPLAKSWLTASLFGDPTVVTLGNTSGALSPGNIGGPNATAGFTTKLSINPWDYVLMLEGALLLRPSLTKRLESSSESGLSYPFTVEPAATGAANIAFGDEKKTRAGKSELWMPLWGAYASYMEVVTCFKEGSVTFNRRRARTGLDFARAISQLGVDRGIDRFQRFIFLKRSGDNDLAVPVGRLKVLRNPQADLVTNLDRSQWLERLRRFARDKNASGRIQQLVRRLEDGIFALTQGGGRPALQNILILLGQIQQTCADSAKAREAISPVPTLGAEWAMEADDNSQEFRLACALAGLTEMRSYLLPLKENKGKIEWDVGSHQAVWGGGELVVNLLRVLDRRLLDAQRSNAKGNPLAGFPTADLAAIMAFLRDETDDERIAGLLAGLVNVKLPQHLPKRDMTPDQPPAAFGLIKPLFTPDAILQKLGLLPADGRLPLPREIITLLKTGNREQVNRAIAVAWRRLRIADLKLPSHPGQPPDLVGIDGSRLAAALMIPLATSDLARICQPFMPVQETN